MTDDAQDVGQGFARADQRLLHRREGRALRGQGGGAGVQDLAARTDQGLGADGADRARRDQQVEDGADAQRRDQADGHVALRVLGFLGRRGDGVEADIGEEDRGGGAEDAQARAVAVAEPAVGGEGGEVGAVDHRQGQDDEDGQGRDLDGDQNGVDARALAGAQHQQARDQQGDQQGRQVHDTAGIGADGYGLWQGDAPTLQ